MKYNVKSARGGRGGRVTAVASIWAEASKEATKPKANKAQPKALAASSTPAVPKPMTSIATKPPTRPTDERIFISHGGRPTGTPAKEDSPPQPQPPPHTQRALFGLGVAAAATPSSPALSSSIATPVLSSTASLAQPPGARVRARAITPTTPHTPSPQPQQQPQPAGTGWGAPLVSGAGLKADLAFGQARLCDLIRRYQGQAA